MDQFLFFTHIFKLTIKAPKLVQKCPKMIEIAIITLDLGSSASITYIREIQKTQGGSVKVQNNNLKSNLD